MNERKREGSFIPCGDAMEKMQALSEDAPESVSGGLGAAKAYAQPNPLNLRNEAKAEQAELKK